ncbi:PAS domain-containing protein [Bradyrhizobium prioriisuperbiae]|uniref:PAS domain-containing protein n=1 Tax=Bradyrhizobium prioriisuperbiae TaxID=2854389 RepID=UPI0028ED135F|nr:PAS domain-containing protein [Bradyrhizobium prioritasuperba]
MAIEVFTGTSIPRDLSTADMEYLWAKWRTLNATNDLTLQRLIDDTDRPLRDRSIALIPVGDDFAYIYVGEAMLDFVKRGASDTLLMRGDSVVSKDLAEVYRRVIREMSPVFIRFTGRRSAPGTLWHQVVFPLPVAGDQVMLVSYSELVSHQLEIYEHLFRTAPDAIAVASPISNDAGHVTDGWVMMMNDRARELLRYTGPIGNLRLSSLPQFTGIDLWGRIYAPRSAVTSTLLTAPDFTIEILRFPHVFGLRLTPKLPAIFDDEVTLASQPFDAEPVL